MTDDSTASRLLATAASLFRRKGYASSSIRELAALLGIQNSSLYHHIRKKEDLLYELCADSLNRLHSGVEKAISGQTDPNNRLRTLIKTHLMVALEDQDKHATMLIELREFSEARRQEVLQRRGAYEALMRQVIADAQSAGALRPDVPAKYMTLALLNLLNWSIFWFRPDGELSAERLSEMLATLFLEGASVRVPDPQLFALKQLQQA